MEDRAIPIATKPKRTEWEKTADDHFSGRDLMNRQTLIVNDQDRNCQWRSHAPKNITGNQRPQRTLVVVYDLGNFRAGSRRHDRGSNG